MDMNIGSSSFGNKLDIVDIIDFKASEVHKNVKDVNKKAFLIHCNLSSKTSSER
jgi:Ni2+-binding GTPase involved in maturation of urease and hydrogenase